MSTASGIDLNALWFVLIGIFVTGYVLLDGFDFGAGMLHLLTKTEEDRRTIINAIAPVWDGNEVWLIAGVGSLFAVFPSVYALMLPGFYLVIYVFLFSLILRAVAIEFRGKESMVWWRTLWDISLGVSSFLASFCLGIILGNLMWGVPLNSDGIYAGSLGAVFHPYALGMGAATVLFFMVHGGAYLVVKTTGRLQAQISRRVIFCVFLFVGVYLAVIVETMVFVPHIREAFLQQPLVWILAMIAMGLLLCIPANIRAGRERVPFGLSCGVIVVGVLMWGIVLFPDLIVSYPNPEHSLNIYNAASAPKTLWIVLMMFAVGMPFVIGYTAYVYRIFKGKVKLDESSY